MSELSKRNLCFSPSKRSSILLRGYVIGHVININEYVRSYNLHANDNWFEGFISECGIIVSIINKRDMPIRTVGFLLKMFSKNNIK